MNLNILNKILSQSINLLIEQRQEAFIVSKRYHSVDSKDKSKSGGRSKSEVKDLGVRPDAREFLEKYSDSLVEKIVIKLQLSSVKARGIFLQNKTIKELFEEKSRVKK